MFPGVDALGGFAVRFPLGTDILVESDILLTEEEIFPFGSLALFCTFFSGYAL